MPLHHPIQTALVAVAVAASVGYAAWRVYRSLRAHDDPCATCQGCPLKEQKQKKQRCERKNQQKIWSLRK